MYFVAAILINEFRNYTEQKTLDFSKNYEFGLLLNIFNQSV